MPVYHFDFFRLENRESVERLGWDDYFFGGGLSVIEWADRFPELIPQQARWILFEIKSENQRAIIVQGRAVSNSPLASGGLETAAS
jgi:tRNA threonylcarbamoyladenosine biosynthesis protein TsaE